MIERAALFIARLARAVRYRRRLHCTWHLAWHKAGNEGSVLA